MKDAIKVNGKLVSFNTISLPAISEEYSSYTEITTISTPITNNGLNGIKNAMNTIESFISDYIYLDRPCSQYDCTGQHFTYGLDRIKRFIDGSHLHYIYIHHVGIDV